MAQQQNPIEEAKRYMANARGILAEQKIEGKYYNDPKYVRMAGNTLWNGILIALEAVLEIQKEKKRGARPDFQDYLKKASQVDKKFTKILSNAYEIIHKSLGYDGVTKVDIVKIALEDTKEIIEWCKVRYKSDG